MIPFLLSLCGSLESQLQPCLSLGDLGVLFQREGRFPVVAGGWRFLASGSSLSPPALSIIVRVPLALLLLSLWMLRASRASLSSEPGHRERAQQVLWKE